MDARITRGVAISDLTGNCLNDRSFNLAAQVEQLLASGEKRILVNLTNVDDISGVYGVGNLVRAYSTCRKEGGELKLICPHKRLLTVFQLARLDSVLVAYPDEDGALASFK